MNYLISETIIRTAGGHNHLSEQVHLQLNSDLERGVLNVDQPRDIDFHLQSFN